MRTRSIPYRAQDDMSEAELSTEVWTSLLLAAVAPKAVKRSTESREEDVYYFAHGSQS